MIIPQKYIVINEPASDTEIRRARALRQVRL
jgi:hypothetical protein